MSAATQTTSHRYRVSHNEIRYRPYGGGGTAARWPSESAWLADLLGQGIEKATVTAETDNANAETAPPTSLASPDNSSSAWSDHVALRGMELVLQRVKQIARELGGNLDLTFSTPRHFSLHEEGDEEVNQVSLEILVKGTSEETDSFRFRLFDHLVDEVRSEDLIRLAILVRES